MSDIQFCPQCGKARAVEEKFCSQCGHSIENFQQQIADSTISPTNNKDHEPKAFVKYPKANVGRRGWACIIDTALILLGILPMLVFSIVMGNILDPFPTIKLIIGFILILGGFSWCVYYSACHDGLKNGQSYGKKINGLMIVCLDTNQPCNKKTSYKRMMPWAFSITIIIDIFMVLFKANGKRLGDILTNTQVTEFAYYKQQFSQFVIEDDPGLFDATNRSKKIVVGIGVLTVLTALPLLMLAGNS